MTPVSRRELETWLIFVSSVFFFALFVLLFTSLGAKEKLVAVAWAVVAVGVVSAIWAWRRRAWSDEAESGSSAELLTRMATGDLTFRSRDIDLSVSSHAVASAMRALLVNLDRTISRFSQLSSDVTTASQQVATHARALANATTGQLRAAETTSGSLQEIDGALQSVRRSVEQLASSAEETSSAAIEMLAAVEEAAGVADSLGEFVEQTASSVDEMIASLNRVASNTEELSAIAVQTAAAIQQISASTEEIAKSAKQSAEYSELATEAASGGRYAVSSTVSGMQDIEDAVNDVRQALGDLGTRSREIGDILGVIEDVARQTNLLALNAAIIAAQAGEHGQAFSVVADEIRDLSQRTAKSTDEIGTIITGVQKSVARTLDQMDVSAKRVTKGVNLASGAEAALESIIELTGQTRESAGAIARAVEEQLRATKGSADAIETVASMVQQTASATAEQSATSARIGEQASTVRDYALSLKRAVDEQRMGSAAINGAIEAIQSAISEIHHSITSLSDQSTSIVDAMSGVETATRETTVSVSSLNRTAATLRQESAVLGSELQRFKLPEPRRGGSVATATVLPDKLTLDPIFQASMGANVIQKAVHETLVKFGEGAELQPGLAERWEILDEGRRYRFHLRKNAKFHNGRPVTANDVEQSLLRLMTPKHESSGRYLTQDIVGARDVIEGRAERAEGIVVRNDHTIDLFLDDPPAFFIMLFTMTKTAIVPVEEASNLERFRLGAVGAGPYAVHAVSEGSEVVLRRNEHYYDADRPRAAEIRFRLDFSNFRDFADAFLRGELDIAHRVPLKLVAELARDPRYAPYLADTVFLHTSYVGFDCSSPPFDRLEVRQAMNHAIDRARINEQVFGGLSVLARTLLPPGLPGYDETIEGYRFDPEKARALLRQAGYANGFELDYLKHPNDEGFNTGQVQLIREDLERVGIRLNVADAPLDEIKRRTARKGHNLLFVRNWFADFPDPDNFFFVFFHSSSTAIAGQNYASPELDRVIESARKIVDFEERAEVYRDLNAKIFIEAPIVPLFHERFYILHKPDVRDLRPCLVTPPVRYDRLWLDR
jgi:ABC-type transport system substrate-binding protein/methyl-accepting chemotaxis protein